MQTTMIGYTARKISPMLAAADMEQTLAFYHDVLGFEVARKSPEYSIVERDGQTIHFMKAASEGSDALRPRPHRDLYRSLEHCLAVGAREDVQTP